MNQATLNQVFEDLAARYQSGALSVRSNVVAGKVEPLDSCDVENLPREGDQELQACRARGLEALASGQVGVVILAGGMATRFQYSQPKGLFPVWDDKSFLELKLEAVRSLGFPVPVFLMTSFATDDAIAHHLRSGQYFGLPEHRVERFRQYQMPRLDTKGGPFYQDGQLSLAAPGHGDFPFAIAESGILSRFIAGGGRYLFFSNVDNLAATVDPVILGNHIRSGAEMTVEVAAKNPGDQGGAPARVNGSVRLIEGFAFPPDFDQSQIDVFNTANYIFDASALSKADELPWYVVEKTVRGNQVVQFEHLAGDLSAVLKTRYLRVSRDERFLPVKTPDDLPKTVAALKERWKTKLSTLC
ncbi:MAG: UTP--glucose-1-phosphate uridylyltransferase [Candidatus Sericytochromatia bacterium]|nr:UTP--glucose-1-phosphate uridylyltransferase [Candidatus Sericytochromatia bacterium]